MFKIEFETGDEDFEDRIVERAAGRLVEQFSEDAQDKLRHMVEEKAAVVVEEAIRKVASEQWVETNRYGEPTGAKTSLAAWANQNWEVLDNGAARVRQGSNTTKERFGDIKQLHVEFWLPLEPGNRGQGRANSGVFLNDTYEVQVLDSFGLAYTSGDCGSLYSIKRPDVNASLPPETWQTYDIEFRTPRLNDDGSIKEGARITVVHNGIKIHDNVQIPQPTANPKAEQRITGPIQLQDHSHPIQYRNIWLVKAE